MTKKQKKNRSDLAGLLIWTTLFCMMLFGILNLYPKKKKHEYKMFPSDEEMQRIEVGIRN
jgi:hypothetical protein